MESAQACKQMMWSNSVSLEMTFYVQKVLLLAESRLLHRWTKEIINIYFKTCLSANISTIIDYKFLGPKITWKGARGL
jgi:hypothetical protein